MITERETKRYNVKPYSFIENSFNSSYDYASDAPIVHKPDKGVLISGCISFVLIAAMCALTWKELGKNSWLIIGCAFLALPIYLIYKYLKNLKTYNAANSAGAEKFDYKAAFMEFIPTGLPEEMPAADLTTKIAPFQGKLQKDIYNNALRDVITKLNQVNNPNDILCKNLTLYGDLMSQQKRRYYMCGEDGKIVVYDSDFSCPRGELVIDEDDVLSFGDSSKYNLSPYIKGNIKVSQDSYAVEIKTNDDGRLFLEVNSREYDKLKKLLGARKEI